MKTLLEHRGIWMNAAQPSSVTRWETGYVKSGAIKTLEFVDGDAVHSADMASNRSHHGQTCRAYVHHMTGSYGGAPLLRVRWCPRRVERFRRLPREILMQYCVAMEPSSLSEPELLRWYWMSLYVRLPDAGIAVTFPSEDAARERLLNVRWPNGIVCPVCEGDRVGQKTARDIYKCNSCGYQTSVTSGTALNSTNIPILLWLLAAEEYVIRQATGRKNMLTNARFMKFLGTRSNDTAVRVKRKLKADLEPGGVGMLLACICPPDDEAQLVEAPLRSDFDALTADVLQRNLTRSRR
ncbi:transposase [Donghicola mangrovi]|uniref:Transposase n=1 Tax=Donghicola mangrovi TaxID=2729614 RepID=A0A850QBN9_9RHOB|nr:transposase [Donghicola mangrovi]NVO23321.1 transposase [Donghicola mangrovi]